MPPDPPFRLMTWACPGCGNSFHVEVAADPPSAAYRCQCPRCYRPVEVPGGEAGEPQPASTPWAVRATPVD